jgi:predicted transcriptional regulator
MSRPDPIETQPSAEDEDLKAAVEAGLASLDQGKTIPYEQVRRWLLSWGTEHELSPPECS